MQSLSGLVKTYFSATIIVLLLSWPAAAKGPEKPYRGAEYRSRAAFLYGRFEVRMKSAPVEGMLSSFFTYHEQKNARNWNEIDIEILGKYSNAVQFNIIVFNEGADTLEHSTHVKLLDVPFNPHREFHVYAIDWTPEYVAWRIDGREVYRQSGAHVKKLRRPQKLMMNIWPPQHENWAGHLDETKLPARAFYDWIRYYRYTTGNSNPFQLEWQDDLNEFDPGRWQKAVHSFGGNNALFVPENACLEEGNLILILNKPGQN